LKQRVLFPRIIDKITDLLFQIAYRHHLFSNLVIWSLHITTKLSRPKTAQRFLVGWSALLGANVMLRQVSEAQ
jgi:hypothetical protein